MNRFLLLLAMVLAIVSTASGSRLLPTAMADTSYTNLRNRMTVEVLPTADVHRVPVQVSVNNVVGMTALEFYLTLPEGVDNYLYDYENDDYVYDKTERWRKSHYTFICNGTIYHRDMLWVSIVSTKSQDFTGDSGPVITVYFDGSHMPDGKWEVDIVDPLIFTNSPLGVETIETPDTLDNFTIEEGKVYPGDTIKSCQVTFMIDQDTLQSEKYPVGAAIIFPDAPERTGYTFAGWPDEEIVAVGDTMFSSTYNINKYKITYLVDDKVWHTDTLEYGTPLTVPQAPTKTGHTFSGWGEIECTASRDTTFAAYFTPIDYKITYMLDGAEYRVDTIPYGAPITPPEAPEREGYTFSGWGDVAETVTGDTTYSGRLEINKYLVTFMVDQDTLRTDTLTYGSALTLPEAPTKAGHTFAGWGQVREIVTADTTYTAQFTINSYVVSFVIDGDTLQTDTLTYGTRIIAPEAPPKTGYSFLGWGEVNETAVADTVYASTYEINTYALTFRVRGEVLRTDSLTYGAAIELPTVEVAGWKFGGWGETLEQMPDHDLDYDAIMYNLSDVNRDLIVNAADVVSIYNYIVDSEYSDIAVEDADVNADGKVNAADVTTVNNTVVEGVE